MKTLQIGDIVRIRGIEHLATVLGWTQDKTMVFIRWHDNGELSKMPIEHIERIEWRRQNDQNNR